MGLLDGKVAIITGAGGGLGRAYAHRFAAEGARVLVNDLGVARDGRGGEPASAEAVAEEIRAAGGTALADTRDVAEDGDGVIAAAVEAFGRVDVLVNNAGILKDKTLVKMGDDAWDEVIRVHLRGTWACTRAAARVMKAQRYGRILNTTSYSGLLGNFGQSNYGAAKAGIVGFTRVIARELARFQITANAIAPMARTRMTEDLTGARRSPPEQVAPVALWLCSDLAAHVTGRVFGAHGRQVFEYRLIPTPGLTLPEGDWTPEALSANLGAISRLPGEGGGASPELRRAVEQLFASRHDLQLPDHPGGALFAIQVGDLGTWTLTVSGGRCRVSPGAPGAPNCTVSFEAPEVLLDLAGGRLSEAEAFASRQIRTDNVGLLPAVLELISAKVA